jgi:hypothetical protein
MFGDFSVLNAENIDDVKVEFIAGRRVSQPFALMGSGGGGIHHDYIAFGNDFFHGITEIRQALEYTLEKLFESCFTLRCILVVLNIVVSHYFIELAEIMFLKNGFAEHLDKLLIFLDLGHLKLTSQLFDYRLIFNYRIFFFNVFGCDAGVEKNQRFIDPFENQRAVD